MITTILYYGIAAIVAIWVVRVVLNVWSKKS